jgi:transcriptional regulator with XRE-family HTH domain
MLNKSNDHILFVVEKTPGLLMTGIAERIKERRLEKNWTQKMLAAKAGISFSSYRRFEAAGEISLRSLIMIAFALDMTDEFNTLFSRKSYQSIDDLLNAGQSKLRKRGTLNE